MTSPVLAALVQTNLREQEERDVALRKVICRHLDLPVSANAETDKSAIAIFKSFCDRHGLVAYPARPATVAYFIHEKAGLGIDELLRTVQAISLEHHTVADPTASGIVAAMLNKIAPVQEPRSWTKDGKIKFRTISYELQRIISDREVDARKLCDKPKTRQQMCVRQQPNNQRRPNPMAFNKTPTLEEQIEALRARIDEFIDARVVEEKKTAENVPAGVIRNILTARSGECQCRAYLQIKSQDEA